MTREELAEEVIDFARQLEENLGPLVMSGVTIPLTPDFEDALRDESREVLEIMHFELLDQLTKPRLCR